MPDLIKDHWFDIALFVGGVVVTAVIGFFQRDRKALSASDISVTPLLSHDYDLSPRLVVTFDGSPVKDPRAATVTFKCDGNVPIRKEDFEKPIQYHFTNAFIISYSIVVRNPSEMELQVSIDNHFLTILPSLLNSGDSFEIAFVVDGDPTEHTRTHRIAGVSKLTPLRVTYVSRTIPLVAATITAAGVSMLLAGGVDGFSLLGTISQVFSAAGVAVGAGIMLRYRNSR